MFCPNCGKEYSYENFCTRCGWNLRSESHSNHQTTSYKTIPIPNHISHSTKHLPSVIGIYKGLWCSLVLTSDAVIIRRENFLQKATVEQIPYSEIEYVTFGCTTERQACGFLSVHRRQSNASLITKYLDAYHDSTSVTFNHPKEDDMFIAFQILSAQAEKNRVYWKHSENYRCPFDIMINIKHIHCPCCASNRISARKRGFDFFGWASGIAVSPVLGDMWAYENAEEEIYFCHKCGYVWFVE